MSYETEYFQRHLAEPLTLALAEICAKRPKDPMRYLAQWLLHWQKNKNELYSRRKELELLLRERQKIMDIRAELEEAFESTKDEEQTIEYNDEPTVDETEYSVNQVDEQNISEEKGEESSFEEEEKFDGVERKQFINDPIIEADEETESTSTVNTETADEVRDEQLT